MSAHPLLHAYEQLRPALRRLGPAMQAYLEEALADGGVHVHAVSHRVKSLPGLAGKLAYPGRTYRQLGDITDLVGVRVITYFEDGVEAAGRVVERALRIDAARSVDKRRHDDPSHFGYQSLHYVCAPPAPFDAELPGVAFEVQIRTILQHAWAEIEHDLGYKSPEAIPLPVRRRFSRLAGLLEIADHEFVSLRRTMEDYARDLRHPTRLDDDAVGLDLESLRLLVGRDPVAALDARLAQALGIGLRDGEFSPEYLLAALRAVGLQRPAEVTEAAAAMAPQLEAVAARYVPFAVEALGFDPTQMPGVERGYSLLMLVHHRVLQAHTLDLHRAEVVRALYQRLDGLTAEAAHRVAEVFVKVFDNLRP
jgi:putative GTP pyrophosphokinase